MKKLIIFAFLLLLVAGCGKTPFVTQTMIDINDIPRFVSTDFVDLNNIKGLSKFRSGAGHEFPDDVEKGSSLKHYYVPKDVFLQTDSSLEVFSPINGTIANISNENDRGSQVYIRSRDYSGIQIRIFHMVPLSSLKAGNSVYAGQSIGFADFITQDSTASNFDIAVEANTSAGFRLISYFQIMKSSLFAAYRARGITDESNMIISKEYRDANPVNWGTSSSTDWIDLN